MAAAARRKREKRRFGAFSFALALLPLLGLTAATVDAQNAAGAWNADSTVGFATSGGTNASNAPHAVSAPVRVSSTGGFQNYSVPQSSPTVQSPSTGQSAGQVTGQSPAQAAGPVAGQNNGQTATSAQSAPTTGRFATAPSGSLLPKTSRTASAPMPTLNRPANLLPSQGALVPVPMLTSDSGAIDIPTQTATAPTDLPKAPVPEQPTLVAEQNAPFPELSGIVPFGVNPSSVDTLPAVLPIPNVPVQTVQATPIQAAQAIPTAADQPQTALNPPALLPENPALAVNTSASNSLAENIPAENVPTVNTPIPNSAEPGQTQLTAMSADDSPAEPAATTPAPIPTTPAPVTQVPAAPLPTPAAAPAETPPAAPVPTPPTVPNTAPDAQTPVPTSGVLSGDAPAPTAPGIVPPPEGFSMSKDEEAMLDQFLLRWEDFGRHIKRVACDVQVMEQDGGLFLQNKSGQKTPISHTYGKFRFIAPNKLLYHVVGEFLYQPGASSDEPAKKEYKKGSGELKFVCDGKSWAEYDFKKRVVNVYPIPEEEWNQDLSMDGPFPLFFIANARNLKNRFYMRIVTPQNYRDSQVWIEAFPRQAADAGSFQRIIIILNLADLQPTYMRKFHVNGKSYSELSFREIEINKGFWNIDAKVDFGWEKQVKAETFAIAPVNAPTTPAAAPSGGQAVPASGTLP